MRKKVKMFDLFVLRLKRYICPGDNEKINIKSSEPGAIPNSLYNLIYFLKFYNKWRNLTPLAYLQIISHIVKHNLVQHILFLEEHYHI